MTIGRREVCFTVDVDSGKVVKVEKGLDVRQTGPDPTLDQGPDKQQDAEERDIGKEIAEIKRSKRHLRVGEIIHTHSSPGCVYWDGVRWVKYC